MNNEASIKIVHFVTHGAGLFVQEWGHIGHIVNFKIFSSSPGQRSDKLRNKERSTKSVFFSYHVAWVHVLGHCHISSVVEIYHF